MYLTHVEGLGNVHPHLAVEVRCRSAHSVNSPVCKSDRRQQTKVLAPHKAIPPRATTPVDLTSHLMQRSMVGGPWMTDVSVKSSIYLRNAVENSPITVTPLLYLGNGTRYVLPDVILGPAGIAIIDVNDELQKLGIAPWASLSGYVELQYTWAWDPLCATIRVVDTAHSLIFTYAFRATLPSPLHFVHSSIAPVTQTLEGLWWKQESGVTGFVTLSNASANPAQINLLVTDGKNSSIGQHSLTIASHSTKLVILPELQSTSSTEGGIRVKSNVTTDHLVVNGGLEDPSVGYSAGMPFATEPVSADPPSDRTFAELGLMTGAADPMMLFPAGTTFTPYSVLRNVSDAPVLLTPMFWWMQGGSRKIGSGPRNQSSAISDSELGREVTVEPAWAEKLQRKFQPDF